MANLGEKVYWGITAFAVGGLVGSIWRELNNDKAPAALSKAITSTHGAPAEIVAPIIRITNIAGETAAIATRSQIGMTDVDQIIIGGVAIVVVIASGFIWLSRTRENTRVVVKVPLTTGPVEVTASTVVASCGWLDGDNLRTIKMIADGSGHQPKTELQIEHPKHEGVYLPEPAARELSRLIDNLSPQKREEYFNE